MSMMITIMVLSLLVAVAIAGEAAAEPLQGLEDGRLQYKISDNKI